MLQIGAPDIVPAPLDVQPSTPRIHVATICVRSVVFPTLLSKTELPYVFNFPHQINNLATLQQGLEVFSQLIHKGANLDDDTVVGQALARAGVYTFRDKTLTIVQNLKLEAEKPRASRGTEAAARDLRRFFGLAGFIDHKVDGSIILTPLGSRLLGAVAGSPQAIAIWRTAMNHVTLVSEEGTGVARPYQTLLRLVRSVPGIEAVKLALALEARDDSEEEFQRILALAGRNFDEVKRELQVSNSHAANATKILPGIARQLGDIRTEQNQNYPTEVAPVPVAPPAALVAGPVAPAPRRRRRAQGRRVDAQTIARDPNFNERPADEADYQNPEDTREARRQRLTRHENVVRRGAEILAAAGYTLYEDPYDILGTRNERPTVLVEVKTLDGSVADEIAQVRAALAQLLYYDLMDVPIDLKRNGLVRVALFESEVSEKHATFLHSMGILVAWRDVAQNIAGSVFSIPKLRELGFL